MTFTSVKIYQFDYSQSSISKIARNQMALDEERSASIAPIINIAASVTNSTDPSPGISVLSGVDDGLLPSPRPDSPSIYSSPPSSPSSSLNTPCIMVSDSKSEHLIYAGGAPEANPND